MSDSRWAIIAIGAIGLAWLLLAFGQRGMRALAAAIAFAEGYGVPGAIPTVRNNPGDLKLTGGVITTFATAAEGWAALYRQLKLIVDGRSAFYTVNMSLADMGRVWTATEQSAWINNVVTHLNRNGYPGVTLATPLSDILL